MNQWYSQAAQDRFVNEVLIKPERMLTGTFLDIGCCHPSELSNTLGLELRGWHGTLVDIDPGAVELCRELRKSPAILADSTKLDFAEYVEPVVDYLSLDVDGATLATLENLLRARVRFRVITIEHDAYRFGDAPRSAMRQLLFQRGYDLVCADVCSAEGYPFEDWWVLPALLKTAEYERFRCEGKRWTEILPP
jgi:hypothetical protein